MVLGLRIEKNKEIKKVTLYKVLINVFSYFILFFSVGVWVFRYRDFQPFELIQYLQTFYISMVGFFIMVSAAGFKLLNQLCKSFFKLFFTVWIMAFIMISTLEQVEQNIYIIYATFIIGYLEVLFEINDIVVNNISYLKLDKLGFKFTDNKSLTILSIPLTVIIVSILHIILAFGVDRALNRLLS
jgi:hypothetical protein